MIENAREVLNGRDLPTVNLATRTGLIHRILMTAEARASPGSARPSQEREMTPQAMTKRVPSKQDSPLPSVEGPRSSPQPTQFRAVNQPLVSTRASTMSSLSPAPESVSASPIRAPIVHPSLQRRMPSRSPAQEQTQEESQSQSHSSAKQQVRPSAQPTRYSERVRGQRKGQ